MSYLLGRSVTGPKCECGKEHFLPGKVTALRFTGERTLDASFGVTWDVMDPLNWDVTVKPDASDSPADVWYTSLSHVMTDDEFNAAFKLLN